MVAGRADWKGIAGGVISEEGDQDSVVLWMLREEIASGKIECNEYPLQTALKILVFCLIYNPRLVGNFNCFQDTTLGFPPTLLFS